MSPAPGPAEPAGDRAPGTGERPGAAPAAGVEERRGVGPSTDGPKGAAIARSAWVPVRARPAHPAEMVSQWLLGETVAVLERRDGWCRARGEDGLEGWAAEGSLRLVDAEAAEAWRERATARSLGTRLRATGDAEPGVGRPRVPLAVPLGSRLRLRPDGRVELPGGATAEVAERASVVAGERLRALFPPDAGAVVRTAERWLGAPYLWGGRTEWGVDCSGLVQAAYALHGVPLPRDSRDQRTAEGRPLALPASGGVEAAAPPGGEPPSAGKGPGGAAGGADVFERLLPGDLLFFAPEGRGITHVALSAGGSRILHAAASNGCVAYDDLSADDPLSSRLRTSIEAALRLF